MTRLFRWTFVGLLAATLMTGVAQAQIRIGQTAGYTGTVAAGVKETVAGAQLFFDSVNARGGIGGQTIELVALDDQYQADKAYENAKKLIDQGVIALFLTRGTPTSLKILPLLAEHKIALVAPSTGAMALHQPVNPWVFNVRASYQREAERAVHHLVSNGVDPIAIVQVEGTFGEDALIGAMKGFDGSKSKPALRVTYKQDKAKEAFEKLGPQIVAAGAKAVVFLGSGTDVVEGVRKLRELGSGAQVVTLSNNASTGFIKQLGPLAYGTIVSQVLPNERSLAIPMVKEAADLAQAAGGKLELSPALMEGYAAAKVLVEGLRRCNKDLTRSNLRRALEGMNRYDLGGIELSFSPTRHSGLDFSDLAIVTADGKFRR
jgi:ABC-type branched-subunit amino acid transport system substrate-binding protein